MGIRRRLSLPLALALVSAAFGFGPNQVGAAQVVRYQPQSPTVSPYLNLTRFNNGGLPNYFALVRPQLQQRQFNVQEQTLLRNQERQIIDLQNDVQRGLAAPAATGAASWFMTPGTQAKYLDTTRFYPEPSFRGRRR
jgi:hypothetical protein